MPTLSTLGAACARAWGFTSGLVKDQYFNLVSLLLPGNGTNGAQNNTFLDSSTNNFTITRNGDTTQGTFSPFSQTGWSNRFDGSANYRLTIPDSTDLDLTGDFCLEMWVYVTANSSSGQLVCIGNENAGQNGFIFYLPGGTTTVSLYTNGGAPLTTSSGAIALNTWHHLALVRSGAGAGNTVIYVDGVSKGSAQITTSFTGIAANGLCIGQTYNGSFVGVSNTYISNVRLVKGSPVYTGAFTPPTSPLTAITNTVLLTCQSNRFVDTNTQTTAKTITVTGSPSVTPFSPFAPTSSYSAAAVGGSGYFDGSADYLSIADNAALQLGTSDFTIETWVYLFTKSPSGNHMVVSKQNYYLYYSDTTNKWYFETNLGLITSASTWSRSQWQHVAATRSGNTFTLWINGQSEGTLTSSSSVTDAAGAMNIGRNIANSSNEVFGHLSGFRLVKGTAVYTAAFTPPTAPLTAITNTSLLLNFTNAGVVDATAKNVLETEGNAQISTAQSKWGGGSIYFDGTGDWLLANNASSDLTNFGAGNFTVEAWIRFDNISASRAFCGKWGGASNRGWVFYYESSNLYFSYSTTGTNAVDAGAAWTPSINVWYYVAAVRNGADLKLYVDGSQIGSTHNISTSSIFASTSTFAVGQRGDSSVPMYGYIDDFRITKGVARTITASPTAPFPVQ